jgi:hypothetical protein
LINNIFTARALALRNDSEEIKKLEDEVRAAPPPKVVINRPKVEYVAGNLRDPFNPSGITRESEPQGPVQVVTKTVENPPALTVQGLVWGGTFPQAIINNKVVKEGDIVEGAKIISIEKKGITVFFKGGQFNLGAPKQEDKSEKHQGG